MAALSTVKRTNLLSRERLLVTPRRPVRNMQIIVKIVIRKSLTTMVTRCAVSRMRAVNMLS